MKPLLFLFLLFLPAAVFSQIAFSEQLIELGAIAEAYEIKGDVVLTNTSAKKIFLMRADADRGIKVYTTKKTLLPDDTCMIVISFIPESAGKFKKKINLIASDQAVPYTILLSGSIATVKTNDRMACVYFGKRKSNPKETPVILPPAAAPRNNPNTLPASPETPRVTAIPGSPAAAPVVTEVKDPFAKEDYKPNNLLFLVDISSSMRDSLKLPLMKAAMHTLIDAARDIDTITLVSYATKVKLMMEAVSGSDKKTLHALVDSLKARGMTAGKTAILFSQQLAQKHYIREGNNQIIIATDGEFKFEQEDFDLWKKKQTGKKIILSTLAFGEEKKALRNLREIAYKGEGSFIHMNQGSRSREKLLEEIKLRSRKR